MQDEVYSIKEVVEDIIDNGSLSKEDVKQLRTFIRHKIDAGILIELLSITHELDWRNVDDTLIYLIVECMKKAYSSNGFFTDADAKELIALFDPEEFLNPFEKRALRIIKHEGKFGTVLRDFMDDHMI